MRKLILAGLAAAAMCAGAGAANAQTVVVQERWGHWDPTWGRDPGPPPHAMWRHWRGHEDRWYGHVHTCMVRYHSHYDYRRDMYRVGHRWVRCRD
jgi:hypothetical protein